MRQIQKWRDNSKNNFRYTQPYVTLIAICNIWLRVIKMESTEYEPISPPVTWFGSKTRLARQITKNFPRHQTFVDVFGGSGAILLAKPPSKVEVYNDLNSKMATLYRVLADPEKSKELERQLTFTPYSRAEFERCKQQINNVEGDIEIARQMIVIQRQSHGGLGNNWSYCVDAPAAGYSASVRKFHAGIERLPEISKRVRKVQVENLAWTDILNRYDRENTLFYLDPPYVPESRVNGTYEHEMTLEDHTRLVECLLELKGHAVLSGYAHAVYEPLEKARWKRIDIDVIASTSKHRAARIESLWISPSCQRPIQHGAVISTLEGQTKRQAGAYRTHELRVNQSELQIKEAINTLKRMKNTVTKIEVSRMTGISRVHLSRRYGHLFL